MLKLNKFNLSLIKTNVPKMSNFFGFFFMIIGFISLIFVEINNGQWESKPSEWEDVLNAKRNYSDIAKIDSLAIVGFPDFWSKELKENGKIKKITWANSVLEINRNLDSSGKRQDLLAKSLTDTGSNQFLSAREKYEEEKTVYSLLKSREEFYEFKIGKIHIISYFLIYLFLFLCSYFTQLRIYKMSESYFSPTPKLNNWNGPYFTIVILLFLTYLIPSFITSFWEPENLYILPVCFFVSPLAWLSDKVIALGLIFFLAIPATQILCYTKKESIPKIESEKLESTEEKFIIEKYVNFLQICTLSIFTLLTICIITTVLWSDSGPIRFEKAFIIYIIGGSMVYVFLIIRMIDNAITIRRSYEDCIKSRFKSFDEFKNSKIFPDPTIEFIGESWWKLPLHFAGIIGTTWGLLKLTGVDQIILNGLK
jgi:hypothetical protein